MKLRAPVFLCCSILTLRAAELKVPLPEAPLRLIIPDPKALDAALSGSYRRFLEGKPKAGEPVVAAWRKSRVGSKLEDQWMRFTGTLPLDWTALQSLQPRSLGLALLDVGNLEAVLVVDTPLAALPIPLPAGEQKNHGGIPYALAVAGAGDKSKDPDRRMGLAWARKGSQLFIATSERALKLALDEALAGRGVTPALPGLVSLELDLDRLRKDRYYTREFLFEAGPETGRVRTALRAEHGQLVELREGGTEPRGPIPTFTVSGAAACGWEPEGTEFWPAFRRGLLEPIPAPLEAPVPALHALPAASKDAPENHYGTDFTRPKAMASATAFEKGELDAWTALLTRTPIPSWGYWIGPDGARRMVFPWPEAQDAAFLEACRATTARRAGCATAVKVGEITELQVGPGLPALALRRSGAYLWVAACAANLKEVPAPQPDAAVVRWARLDLGAVRREAGRWARVEGPASPERVRPLSDRVLGLLGWMPATKAISVERRKTAGGWREKVVFSALQPQTGEAAK